MQNDIEEYGINRRSCAGKEVPWWQKYTLTLNEASEYLGIGYKKLKMFVQEHSDAEFVLWNGNRAQIKRAQFEKYLDEQMNVI